MKRISRLRDAARSAFRSWRSGAPAPESGGSSESNGYVPFQPTNFKLDAPPLCTNLFLHARNTSNMGDLAANPGDYFTLPGQSESGDFWSSVNRGVVDYDNIIVGGGVYANNFAKKPEYFRRLNPKKHLIIWGAGLENPGGPAMASELVERSSLIGTRDYRSASAGRNKVFFCPCSSAMDRAFDVTRPEPVHEVVCFTHHNKAYPGNPLRGYPTMHNYGDFIEAIDFLASGKIVITDSYHGLYWATLLSKKVVCLERGGKFNVTFKWQPVYASPSRHRDALENADDIPFYPDALRECRELNMQFYARVLNLLTR